MTPYNFISVLGEHLELAGGSVVPYTNEQLNKNCQNINKLIVSNYRNMLNSRVGCDTNLFCARPMRLRDFNL